MDLNFINKLLCPRNFQKNRIYIFVIIILIFLDLSYCLRICGDWTPYGNIKCIKVVKQLATFEEAVHNCTDLDQTSTLISIHSKEEQDFLSDILNKYNDISPDSWIGMKYESKVYKWMDGSFNNYTNWATDAVKDGSDKCVQMYISKLNFGKWTDMSCKKTSLIVCQIRPKIDPLTLALALQNLTITVQEQKIKIDMLEQRLIKQHNELNSTNHGHLKENHGGNHLVPIGFIYNQLPLQISPEKLFPDTKWEDVSKLYAGLFFRAEGGDSLPFGKIQHANQSSISDVYFDGYTYDTWSYGHYQRYMSSLPHKEWALLNANNSLAIWSLRFFTTDGEVRPKNTAIKIWKRVE